MRFLNLAAVALIASPLALAAGSAMAASAHNSQAGAYGDSKNPTDSTPGSPRVKHSAKHKGMMKKM
ncbi:MAG: hypothetical protein ACRYGP_19470 [Janthinobacterium lividum]